MCGSQVGIAGVYPCLTQLIKEIDIDAFIIIGDAGQINGEGFKENGKEEKTLKDIIKNRKERNKFSFKFFASKCKELFS